MVIDNMLRDTLHWETPDATGPELRKSYFFHDVQIACLTNHPEVFPILDEMLDVFPRPSRVRGVAAFSIRCYEGARQFAVRLPRARVRTETVALVTDTKLKYYRGEDGRLEYQSYSARPPINEAALSVIDSAQPVALTQLEAPQRYAESFLRRYIFLLALGRVLQQFEFEPCHAAAVTAPWDADLGALIIGASGSGKTTLSVGCASEGFGLLGDDLVMLREGGAGEALRAYAITHEVSVRADSLKLWQGLSRLQALPADLRGKRYCHIEEVYPGAGKLQAPIRMLIFSTVVDAAKSTVVRMSKASALQELVEQCMRSGGLMLQEQERQFTLLSALAEHAPGYRVAVARGHRDGPEIVRALLAGGAA